MQEDQVSKLAEEIANLNVRISELERLVKGRIETPQQPGVQAAPRPQPVAPTPPPRVIPQPAPKPARKGELEAEIGGNWLNKIGAVAMVLGMAFFLKYAIDNHWINETGRIIIGIIVGLAFIYLGEYFYKKDLGKYAQGISGAGIAILYFTIFAAFSFYGLIDQLPAFGFMIVVTAAAIAISVKHNAVAIAILGIIGAFLTPVLLQNPVVGEGDNQVGLFTYIAILNLGILGITYYKNWRELNLLSLVGTVLVFMGWYVENYVPAKLGITLIFLTIYFAIFAAQSLVQNVIARRPMNPADFAMVLATPSLYFWMSYSLLAVKYHIYLGGFALAVAAIYLVISYKVEVPNLEMRGLRMVYLAIAAGFLTIAIPLQLEQQWVTIGWAAEGAVLAGIGFYLNSIRTRYVSIGLLGLVAIRLLFVETFMYMEQVPMPFFNERFVVFLVGIAMISLVVWLQYKNEGLLSGTEKVFRVVLVLGANFLMLWALSVEVLASVNLWHPKMAGDTSAESFALSAVWTLYAVAMLIGGIIWQYRAARIMSLVIFGIVIAKTFLYDVWMLERIYKILAFIGLAVMLFLASYFYQVKLRRGAEEGTEDVK